MAHCARRSITQCLRDRLRFIQRDSNARHLSDQTFVKSKKIPENDGLLDLEVVHKEWKAAGYFPRAPPHVTSHGSKCINTLLRHNNLTRHVFGEEEYRLFLLNAHFRGKLVDFGGIVSPSQAASPLEVSWDSSNLNTEKSYTLIMLSPDCSSCCIHWYVRDISPFEPFNHDVTTLLDYVPPVPLKGTGFYRYVLVLLEQNSNAVSKSVTRSATLPQLILEQDLAPVGVAFFHSLWDSSVGHTLATHLNMDEKQYVVQRPKDNKEHYAEELFLRKEWEMKTSFM